MARYVLEADFGDHVERLIPAFPAEPGERDRFIYRTPPLEMERPVSIHQQRRPGRRGLPGQHQGHRSAPRAELITARQVA